MTECRSDYERTLEFHRIFCEEVVPLLNSRGYSKSKKKMDRKLKQECIQILLKAFGDVEWSISNSIEQDKYSEIIDCMYGDVPNFLKSRLQTKFFVDDSFSGIYKGVRFSILEIVSQIRDKGSRWIFITFDANKKYKEDVYITSYDLSENSLLTYLAYIIIFMFFVTFFYFGFMRKEPIFILFDVLLLVSIVYGVMQPVIHLEDSVFEKRFRVLSKDEVEARYILTPSFMERMLKLKVAFDSFNMRCKFSDSKVKFLIGTTKNLFEIGGDGRRLDDPKGINAFYNEFSSILKMIELFKLDEKTGL